MGSDDSTERQFGVSALFLTKMLLKHVKQFNQQTEEQKLKSCQVNVFIWMITGQFDPEKKAAATSSSKLVTISFDRSKRGSR